MCIRDSTHTHTHTHTHNTHTHTLTPIRSMVHTMSTFINVHFMRWIMRLTVSIPVFVHLTAMAVVGAVRALKWNMTRLVIIRIWNSGMRSTRQLLIPLMLRLVSCFLGGITFEVVVSSLDEYSSPLLAFQCSHGKCTPCGSNWGLLVTRVGLLVTRVALY